MSYQYTQPIQRNVVVTSSSPTVSSNYPIQSSVVVPTPSVVASSTVVPSAYSYQPGVLPGTVQYAQPYQRTVVSSTPAVTSHLPHSVGVQSEVAGGSTFDPDPVTNVYTTQAAPQRVIATGPYGVNGQQAQVSGVYRPPAVRHYVTSDLHEHPVVATSSPSYVQAPMVQAPLVQTSYVQAPVTSTVAVPHVNRTVGMRAEVIGGATFDPDPVTNVYYTQPAAQRVIATGPYGAGGQQTQISGVYRPPAVRHYVTTDLHEHPVVAT